MKTAKRIGCIVLAIVYGIVLFVTLLCAALLIADTAVDATARTLPSYPREDISALLEKEQWTDTDYETLYRQTGVGRTALDEMKDDPQRILSFQDALFYDGELDHEIVAFTTKRDIFADSHYTAPMVDLQDGDVLLTSTCHTFGWRNGHSAIVVDGALGSTLESVSLGIPSELRTYGSDWFRYGTNFLVLRLKGASAEERAQIAATAAERLCKVPYSLTVGFLSPKDQGETPRETHCSHLVWQAFYYFGYDIDSDGGPLCSTHDIAQSDLFEVVQVFGFDPVALW